MDIQRRDCFLRGDDEILPGDTPCLRCVFPEMPLPGTTPTCDTAGVLNGIVGAITGVASTEALKILLHSDKDQSRDVLDGCVGKHKRAHRTAAPARLLQPVGNIITSFLMP